MSNNKRIEKITNRHLDKIYKTSVKVAKSWSYDGVPISTLAYMIPNYHMGEDVELPEHFKSGYNTMLDQLLNTCKAQAVNKMVSFPILKENIRIMKESFSKGLNG